VTKAHYILQDTTIRDEWFDSEFYDPDNPEDVKQAFDNLKLYKVKHPNMFFRLILRTESVVVE
jgi:hypothetical protein